jgi:hypothetical protein
MRSVAAAAFVAVGFGCNSILGLDTATLYPDAQPNRIQITSQALIGVPDVIEYLPLEGLDKVKLAPMGSPFDDHPCSEQAPPCTQSFDNMGFALPASLVGQPYRMLYQPQGDPIPHEVQWSFTTPHICVPYFGKAGQPAAPSNATIQITAQSGPPNFNSPMVFTYGRTWSAGPTQASAPNPVDYAFSTSAKPVEAPLATIQTGTDAAMIVDFDLTMSGACPVPPCANGGAKFSADLQAETTVLATGMWQAPPQTMVKFLKDDQAWLSDYLWLNGDVGGPGAHSMIYGGVIPSAKMPPFAVKPFTDPLDPLAVPLFTLALVPSFPAPAMQTLQFVDPFDPNDRLPAAVAYQIAETRMIDGVSVSHSLQWAFLSDQVNPNATIAVHAVGVPREVTLNAAPLQDDDQRLVILAGAASVPLVFTLNRPADECVATLYQINPSSSLVALRTYQAPTTTTMTVHIEIDTSVFTAPAGTKFVFGIQCRSGLPDAPVSGDQSRIQYPFSVSTIFPGAFTVQ